MEFTTSEAVALTGLDESEVRKDVELGVVETSSPPRFQEAQLIYFRARQTLGMAIAPSGRRTLMGAVFEAIQRHQDQVEWGPWVLHIGDIRAQLTVRWTMLQAWMAERIECKPGVQGGQPVIVGTRLTVHDIGARLLRADYDQAALERELLEDYPYLRQEDFEFIRMFELAYPKLGRPRASASS